MFWDKRVLEVIETMRGVSSVSCLFRNVEDGFQWIFTGVYGLVLANLKENLWEELVSVKGLWSRPWCIRGDFNVTISPSESNKGGNVTQAMRRFAEVIDDLGVRDMPLHGGPFTWSGGSTMKGILCGGRLLEESLVRCKGDGVRGRAGIVLGHAYGKKSGETGRLSLKMPNL